MPRPFDPSGIDLQRQGMDTFLANQDAQRRTDYGPGGSAIDQAVHMTGPLPDPKWQAFFQALQNQGVSKITSGPRGYQGTPSPQPSNQITGTSAQPDFFTGGDTFMGRTTAPFDYGYEAPYAGRVGAIKHPTGAALPDSLSVLKNRARPTPDWYGPVPAPPGPKR
jgi:hypothetical protein